ncbi:MAG: hypothetical protein ACRDJM_04780 [Actinomycetota bacterium]
MRIDMWRRGRLGWAILLFAAVVPQPAGAAGFGHEWSKRLGGLGMGDDYAFSVASDPSGAIMIAGGTSSDVIDLGGGPLIHLVDPYDMVLAKYSGQGEHLWSKRIGGQGGDEAHSVATDPGGAVVMAGETDSPSIDMGGGPLTGPVGYSDLVVAKYSPQGEHLWSRRIGGPNWDAAYSVASDSSGAVLVAGRTDSSSIDFGGGPLTGEGSSDIVLAKYSSSGLHLWSKRLGGPEVDFALSGRATPREPSSWRAMPTALRLTSAAAPSTAQVSPTWWWRSIQRRGRTCGPSELAVQVVSSRTRSRATPRARSW